MTVGEYKQKVLSSLDAYYKLDVCERSLNFISSALKCLKELDEICTEDTPLTARELADWNARMVNDDGSTGYHWTLSDTTQFMNDLGIRQSEVSAECWNATMNMMYSDYCDVAAHYGVAIPDFYAHLAKAFLYDKDGKKPSDKLSDYYRYVVK